MKNKQLNTYKKININGFTVDMYDTVLHKRPTLSKRILDTKTDCTILTIRCFDTYNKSKHYIIKAMQYKKNKDNNNWMIGTGFYKVYKEEVTKDRFSFVHMKNMASEINIEELTTTIEKDLKEFFN